MRSGALNALGADRLLEEVLVVWQVRLEPLVPAPAQSERSDYERHARWLEALHELAPESASRLLALWRRDHLQRRNLLAGLAQSGILVLAAARPPIPGSAGSAEITWAREAFRAVP